MRLDGNTALITGGSSGIGLAIAKAFRERGSDVVLLGRDGAKLRRAMNEVGAVDAIEADLATAEGRGLTVDAVQARHPSLNVLINNAGLMVYADLLDPDRATDGLDEQVETLLKAPMELSLRLLPLLGTKPEAAIVNVTTGLVFAPVAGAAAYSAAKAGLRAFTRALRYAVRETPVRVVELMPPAVTTELSAAFSRSAGLDANPPGAVSPERVAADLLKALAKDRPEARVGQAGALGAMSRLAPDFVLHQINRALARKA